MILASAQTSPERFDISANLDDHYRTLSGYASNYSLNVLMSNYTGQSWGLQAGGQSGFWDKNDKLVSSLNGSEQGLLVVEKTDSNWIAKTIKY